MPCKQADDVTSWTCRQRKICI